MVVVVRHCEVMRGEVSHGGVIVAARVVLAVRALWASFVVHGSL